MSKQPDKSKAISLLRKAETKALTEAGHSISYIANMLGISESTVVRYRNQSNEDVKELQIAIKKHWQVEDFKLAELAKNKIYEKIDTAKFYDLTGLYKISRELQMPRQQVAGNNNVQVVINNNKDEVSISENMNDNN